MILLFESLGNIAGSRSGKGKGGGSPPRVSHFCEGPIFQVADS